MWVFFLHSLSHEKDTINFYQLRKFFSCFPGNRVIFSRTPIRKMSDFETGSLCLSTFILYLTSLFNSCYLLSILYNVILRDFFYFNSQVFYQSSCFGNSILNLPKLLIFGYYILKRLACFCCRVQHFLKLMLLIRM